MSQWQRRDRPRQWSLEWTDGSSSSLLKGVLKWTDEATSFPVPPSRCRAPPSRCHPTAFKWHFPIYTYRQLIVNALWFCARDRMHSDQHRHAKFIRRCFEQLEIAQFSATDKHFGKPSRVDVCDGLQRPMQPRLIGETARISITFIVHDKQRGTPRITWNQTPMDRMNAIVSIDKN